MCQEHAGQLDDALGSYDKCLDMMITLAINLENCLFRSDIRLPHSVYIAVVKGTVLCLNERLILNCNDNFSTFVIDFVGNIKML